MSKHFWLRLVTIVLSIGELGLMIYGAQAQSPTAHFFFIVGLPVVGGAWMLTLTRTLYLR